jgi:hypothetical protein
MIMANKKKVLLVFVLALFWSISNANAEITYPFEVITANGDYFEGGQLDLSLEVENIDSTVSFIFENESTVCSSIARIYFEQTMMLIFEDLFEGDGTDFEVYTTPPSLPAGQTIDPAFERDDVFSVGAESPPPTNGINPGEQLTVNFKLADDTQFNDVIEALNTGLWRIGIHIIALPDGSSESAITIPEPTTLLIMGTGIVLFIRKIRTSNSNRTGEHGAKSA